MEFEGLRGLREFFLEQLKWEVGSGVGDYFSVSSWVWSGVFYWRHVGLIGL